MPVMITGLVACDNVAFGGVQIELQPPEEAPSTTPTDTPIAEEGPDPLVPIETSPLVYAVQRTGGSTAAILPIAQHDDEEYESLPDPEDVPDLIERFALRRWEQGAEFALLAGGRRVGTFVADGTTVPDNSTCMIRPRGSGFVEVLPDAVGLEWFLAVPTIESAEREPWTSLPALLPDAALRAASLNLAQRMIPQLDILWPTSIPEIRRDLQPLRLGTDGIPGLAVSYVYGDRLTVGQPNPRAYSLFMLAVEGETPNRYDPVLTWYQEASRKAFPRLVGAHDLRKLGVGDAVLEVYGESSRWFTILGVRGNDWSVLYLDACGEPASGGALRSYP